MTSQLEEPLEPEPEEPRRRSAPTIVDVAELAGVSKSLVSLVMRDAPNVSDERRAAVKRAARELGYRPNAVARSLAQQRTFIIGVVVSDFSNPFFAEILEGIEEAAVDAGYQALFNTGSRDVARELEALDTMLQLRIDGLVLASPQFDDEALGRVPRRVPTLVIGRQADVTGIDVVTNNDELGGELVVEHLVGLGHRRIAHLHGGGGAGAEARARGFGSAMAARGLDPIIVQASFTEQGGVRAAEQLLALDEMPTAVFAANDLAAMGAMETLERAGLRIPDDVSLVGYDNIHIAGLGHIALTTVDQPRGMLGSIAVKLLLERIDGKRVNRRRVLLDPTFVTRRTTGPPPKGA